MTGTASRSVPSGSTQPLRLKLDVKVSMRDGVLLSADIYRPPTGDTFPVLLLRTIYDNQQGRYVEWARSFVQAGYAVVMQDCRGRFDSDGVWEPYIHETEDGYDTHEWIGRQPWCNGKIGTFGISYPGFTQTLPAKLRSKYLTALAPIASQQDNFGHIYVDGVLHLHIAMFFINVVARSMQRE
jgi:putative CocE/NonD family hydrolase